MKTLVLYDKTETDSDGETQPVVTSEMGEGDIGVAD